MNNLKKTSRHLDVIVVLIILLIGLFVRQYGVNYGLPYLYDTDEPEFVGIALNVIRNLDINPHKFSHPASTLFYSLSIIYGLIYLVGHILGVFHEPNDFVSLYRSNPTVLYASGRMLTVIFGIL